MSERPKEWIKEALAELNERLAPHGGSASVTGYDEEGAPIVAVEHPTLHDEAWRQREEAFSDWGKQYGI